ncbi:hypothetical protein EZV62_027088 [Acer yangbiense]|uniref:Fe2OG dioxygenase domain-containing protein n=1 Tax=Acer yangbiense TaxID=1000413 RepID=A0A5C7GSP4_9ROSI|nr:hypothetical protein EZV62_027088 [Acer yangbiense]
MEPKLANFGSSLPVPYVQELAKEPLTAVPPRYVRPDQDPPFISNTTSSPQVPVIDLIRLLSGDSMESELEKFHYACQKLGFFQIRLDWLINHGVSTSLVEKVKVEIQEFFKQPMEDKKKYCQQAGDIEGYGQTFVMSEEQKLDWADMFHIITLPTHLRKPHLLPNLPLPLRFNFYPLLNQNLFSTLMIFVKMRKSRMNYFPPCPQPELVIGLNPHSDATGLTILLQLNEMEGLQIIKDGMWVPVKPLPDAFIINIGDMLEIVTNGIYKSIEHRATVNSSKERLSIATFYNPKLEGAMGPAPSLITPETPALFRRIGVTDYFKGFFSRELHGRSYVDVMRIQNGSDKSN